MAERGRDDLRARPGADLGDRARDRHAHRAGHPRRDRAAHRALLGPTPYWKDSTRAGWNPAAVGVPLDPPKPRRAADRPGHPGVLAADHPAHAVHRGPVRDLALPDLPAAQADRLGADRDVPRRRAVGPGQPPQPVHEARLRDRDRLLRPAGDPDRDRRADRPAAGDAGQQPDPEPARVRAGRARVRRRATRSCAAWRRTTTSPRSCRSRPRSCPARIGDAANVLGNIGLGVVNSLFALFTILVLAAFLLGSGRDLGQPRARAAAAGARGAHPRRARPHEQGGRRLRRRRARAGHGRGGHAPTSCSRSSACRSRPRSRSSSSSPTSCRWSAPRSARCIVGVVTLFSDFPTATIIWAIYSIIYQQIENTLIQPQIQKRAVNVHPFIVLVAVLFGVDAARRARRARRDPHRRVGADRDPRVVGLPPRPGAAGARRPGRRRTRPAGRAGAGLVVAARSAGR